MSEKKPLEESFFDLLKDDITLIAKPDELNALLDERTAVEDMWNFRALKKVLSLNIGKKILPAMNNETDLKKSIESLREMLQTEEIKEDRINYILELIENTVTRIKEAKIEEEKIFAEKSSSNDLDIYEQNVEPDTEKEVGQNIKEEIQENAWYCQNCGEKNIGKFCANCGTSKDGIQPQHQTFSKVNLTKTAPIEETPVQETFIQTPTIREEIARSEPYKNFSEKSSQNKNILLIAAGLIICFFIGFMVKGSDNSDKTPPTQIHESNTLANSDKSANTAKAKEPQKPKPADAPGELSFGEIYIGQPESEVRRILGSPNKITTPSGATHPHHEYEDITVIISDGKVSGFISNSDKFASKRGLYEGSTRADVEKAYGKSGHSFNADGYDIIMEYPFTSEDNRPCLLRFAIKNDKVYYVSARIWQEEEERQRAQSPEAAKNVFVGFHEAITNRNFNLAFSAYTTERQSRYNNSWQKFSEGYATTVTSKIMDLSLISSNNNEAVFAYRLLARDRENNGIVRRIFDGKAILRLENGEWRIAETESRKVSEDRE